MSEQTPRKGDTVRWTSVIEGVVEDFFPGEIHINDGGDDPDGNVRVLPMGEASVEVLERADHASRDRTGTIRQDPKTGRTAQKVDRSDAPWMEYTLDFTDYEWLEDGDVRDWPVIGSAPGTPAAADAPLDFVRQLQALQRRDGETDEAYIGRLKREGLWQEPAMSGPTEDQEYPEVSGAGVPYPPQEPVALPLPVRQRVAELLVAGRKSDAVAVLADLGWTHDLALQQVESMPEWQTGRNHRPVDEVALPPLHVDNEAIVQGRYPEVSGSGVPHPPLDNEGIETGLYFAEKKRRRAAGEVV